MDLQADVDEVSKYGRLFQTEIVLGQMLPESIYQRCGKCSHKGMCGINIVIFFFCDSWPTCEEIDFLESVIFLSVAARVFQKKRMQLCAHVKKRLLRLTLPLITLVWH